MSRRSGRVSSRLRIRAEQFARPNAVHPRRQGGPTGLEDRGAAQAMATSYAPGKLFSPARIGTASILSRWDRTAPVGVVGAVGVVCVVEVHDGRLVESRGLHFEVAPGPVRLLAAR